MIDPQLQGITWIKEKLKDDGLISMRIGSKNYLNKIERSIEDGTPVLLENLEEYIDPIIFPIIARKIVRRGGKVYLDFGGKKLDLHPDFRLYMQSKMSNPNYPPEIQAEAALINFTVTETGLSDQLLTLVVGRERPDLAQTKIQLIKEQNKFKITLKDLEANLLDKLTNAKGNLLENIELIENLEESKRLSTEIKEKVEIAKVTEKEITEASEMYRPSAVRGALIFFLMNELYKMSSFYMYSLESFVNVINLAIDYVTEDKPAAELPEGEGEEGAEGEKKEDAPAPEEEKKEDDAAEDENKEGDDAAEDKEAENDDDGDAEEENDEGEEENDIDIDEPKPDAEIAQEEFDNVEILTPRSLQKRVKKLTDSITYTAFSNVRRGLFEKHKLIFATLMTFRILIEQGELLQSEVDHLIVGKQLTQKVLFPESESLRSYITE